MEELTMEVEKAIAAELYYLAIVMALGLPDICAALESQDGATAGARYRAWYDTWAASSYPDLTSVDLYSLRCGLVHQGRLGHPNMQYGRVLFTIPNSQGSFFHKNIIGDALNLDAVTFCRDMVQCVLKWYSAKKNDPIVQANLPRLIRFRPNGLAPYMVGMPLIA